MYVSFIDVLSCVYVGTQSQSKTRKLQKVLCFKMQQGNIYFFLQSVKGRKISSKLQDTKK